MCGRFTLKASLGQLASMLSAALPNRLEPRYNVAPEQQVLAIRQRAPQGPREFVFLEWGLVPYWADAPEIGHRLINARCETLATKASFRIPFHKRRCLIVADGFCEWQRRGHHQQPYLIQRKDERPFAFAGLWDRWQQEGVTIESCVVITTDANDLVRPLHDRMPVIIAPQDYELWLDPGMQAVARLQPFLRPSPSDHFAALPVSTLVNDPNHDVAACVEPTTL